MGELNRPALTLALGATWATFVWSIGIAATVGLGRKLVDAMASLYRGYDASITGSFIGAMWGFVDGALAGYMIATMYNRFLARDRVTIDTAGVPVDIES